MANFFDKIKKTAENVSKSTSNQLQTAKLKLKIDSLEKSKSKVLTQLGEVIYNQYKNGAVFKDCDEIINSIDSYEEDIKRIQEEIEELNAVNRCSNCEKEIEEGTKFCPYCGTEQIIPQTELDSIEERSNLCTNCKTQLSKDAKFCNKCGTKVESN